MADTATRELSPIVDEPPLRLRCASKALARCAFRTCLLLARRRLHQPRRHVGSRLRFADGTTTEVYRETAVGRLAPSTPAVLVVSFRLRGLRGEFAHAAFRLESELNTVLFAGFPGLVSKLWLRHDEHGVYRGLYEWDDPRLAASYARALWWVLALVSVPGSVHWTVLPGLRREMVLNDPGVVGSLAPAGANEWWRPTGWEPAQDTTGG